MEAKILMSMCRKNGGGVVFAPALNVNIYWGHTFIRSMYIGVNDELVICDRPNNDYDRSVNWYDFDTPTRRAFFDAISEKNVYDKNLF